MRVQLIRGLFAHMEWADARVWRTAMDHSGATEDEYVMDGLVHLHLVQRAYLSVWRGEEVQTVTQADFEGPTDIRAWALRYYPEATTFLDDTTEEQLDEVVPLPWTEFIEREIGGPPSPANLEQMLLQVVMHSAHHRAQINRRLRELGAEPSMIDYVAWVWRGRPPPDAA